METIYTFLIVSVLLAPLRLVAQTFGLSYQATVTSCGSVEVLTQKTGSEKLSNLMMGSNGRLIVRSKDLNTFSFIAQNIGWNPFTLPAIGSNGSLKVLEDWAFVSGTPVFSKPSMSIEFCKGQSASLDIASNLTIGSPAKWIVDGSTNTTRTFNNTQDKTYLVSAIKGNCTDTLHVNINVIEVAPSFIVSAKSDSAPLTVTFQSTSEEDADQFEWRFGTSGALNTNTSNPTFTYTAQGNYDVTLYTSKAGTDCKDSVTYKNFINAFPTGLSEFIASNITLYPNPTSGLFTVANSLQKDLEPTLYTVSGKEIKKLMLPSGNSQIDLSDQEPGVYMLQMLSKKNSATHRNNVANSIRNQYPLDTFICSIFLQSPYDSGLCFFLNGFFFQKIVVPAQQTSTLPRNR